VNKVILRAIWGFSVIALSAAMVTGVGCNDKEKEEAKSEERHDSASKDKGSESKSDKTEEVVAKATKQWDAALGTVTIKGVVKFSGKAPKRKPIDMGGKPECAAHAAQKPLDETVIVNPDGTLKNVFVYVRKGVDEWIFPIPEEPALIEQKGCTFVPHVLGVRAGQKLMVRNADSCAHNVRAAPSSGENAGFNFTQTRLGAEDLKTFNHRDVFVKVNCDIHGWMGANIGVVENPFFAITGEDGKFELKGLPKGEFTIEARHEEYGRKTQTVTAGDKETKVIEFEFSKKGS
jgi:plastocyanin